MSILGRLRGPRSLIPAAAVEVASLEYTLLGRPHSWARDNAIATGKRDKRGRAGVRFITDEGTRVGKLAHQANAMRALVAQARRVPRPDADHEWAVTVEAYYPTRVMGDIDRVTTLVLDALEGLVYVSDRQVASIRGERFVDRDNPRTVVRIARMGARVEPRLMPEVCDGE